MWSGDNRNDAKEDAAEVAFRALNRVGISSSMNSLTYSDVSVSHAVDSVNTIGPEVLNSGGQEVDNSKSPSRSPLDLSLKESPADAIPLTPKRIASIKNTNQRTEALMPPDASRRRLARPMSYHGSSGVEEQAEKYQDMMNIQASSQSKMTDAREDEKNVNHPELEHTEVVKLQNFCVFAPFHLEGYPKANRLLTHE